MAGASLIAACIGLFVIGTALFVRGLVGRRVGDEPRCRRCRYNLTALASNKCPECGLVLGPGATHTGLRYRRYRALVVGAVFITLGAVLAAPATRQWINGVNWYRYLPSSWVIRAAGNGNSRAFEVVDERSRAGRLTNSQLQDVAEAGLTLYEAFERGRSAQLFVDLLGFLKLHGRLSASQVDRFYRQMFRVVFELRPVVRRGDSVPYRLRYVRRGPSDWPGRFSAAVKELRIDGEVDEEFLDNAADSGFIGPFQVSHPRLVGLGLGELEIGKHRIEIDVEVEIFEHETGELLSRQTITCSAPLEIVATPGDSVSPADKTVTADRVRQAIQLRVYADWGGRDRAGLDIRWEGTEMCGLCGTFTIRTPQGGLAGAVVASYSAESKRMISGTSHPATVRAGDWVFVTFQSSRELARESLHITRYWEGRLLFGPIQVESVGGAKPNVAIAMPTTRPAWADDDKYYTAPGRRRGFAPDGSRLMPRASRTPYNSSLIDRDSANMAIFRQALTSRPAGRASEAGKSR